MEVLIAGAGVAGLEALLALRDSVYLPRWLTEHGVVPPVVQAPPDDEGVTVNQPLSRMSGAEQKYLFELAHQFRSGNPAIAWLGRRMREAREH
jgi:hypothetical protein